MRKLYVIYDTTPFQGFIRFTGRVDDQQPPDGSTHWEYVQQLLADNPTTTLYLFDTPGALPDQNKLKFDNVNNQLVPLEAGDITPDRQAELTDEQKNQDIETNMPSWQTLIDEVNAMTSVPDIKAVVAKLARVTYWLAKGTED